MSVTAPTAAPAATTAKTAKAATPGGAQAQAGAAPGDGGDAFAALLAGLGAALDGAAAADMPAADAGADPNADAGAPGADAALHPGANPLMLLADPQAASPAAAGNDPLAGMALLLAQHAGTAAAPPAKGAAAGDGAAALAGAATATATAANPTTALGKGLPGAGSPGASLDTDAWVASGSPGPAGTAGASTRLQPQTSLTDSLGASASQPAAALATPALPDVAALGVNLAAPAGAAGAAAPAVALPVHHAALASQPGDAAFAGDLAAQVKLLVDGGLQQAELRLNPAELGPVQIQLSMNTQTADIHFAAVHSLTRDSIEQALPQLREMLEAQGLSLGETGVSGGQQQGAAQDGAREQARAQQTAGGNRAATVAGAGDGQGGALAGLGGSGTAAARRGLLDLYA